LKVDSEKGTRFGSTSNYVRTDTISMETTTMAGFGRFKLTDALPEQAASIEPSQFPGGGQAASIPGGTKGKGKGRGKSASAKGKPALGSGLAAEQLREARENDQAKNAEGSIRDRMVDIGRGNQQAGRSGHK
jgi:hypothetical protein